MILLTHYLELRIPILVIFDIKDIIIIKKATDWWRIASLCQVLCGCTENCSFVFPVVVGNTV